MASFADEIKESLSSVNHAIFATKAAAAAEKAAGAAEQAQEAVLHQQRDPRIQAGLEDAEFWYERYKVTQTSPWDEDEPLELFLRAWFVQPPEKRIELLIKGKGYLYKELSTLFWRTHLLERDDARMMVLVDKITREPGGEALDGVWRAARLFELGAVRCIDYLATQPDSELSRTIRTFRNKDSIDSFDWFEAKIQLGEWFDLAKGKGYTKILEWGVAQNLYYSISDQLRLQNHH